MKLPPDVPLGWHGRERERERQRESQAQRKKERKREKEKKRERQGYTYIYINITCVRVRGRYSFKCHVDLAVYLPTHLPIHLSTSVCLHLYLNLDPYPHLYLNLTPVRSCAGVILVCAFDLRLPPASASTTIFARARASPVNPSRTAKVHSMQGVGERVAAGFCGSSSGECDAQSIEGSLGFVFTCRWVGPLLFTISLRLCWHTEP